MEQDTLLPSAISALHPSDEAKGRIRLKVLQRIATPQLLKHAALKLSPTNSAQERLWQRIGAHLQPVPQSLLDSLNTLLAPPPGLATLLRARILGHIVPTPSFHWSAIGMRWSGALVLCAVLLRISPLLVMAPRIQAETNVLAVATVGTFAYSTDDLHWHTGADQITLAAGTSIATNEAEVSIVFHDNAVLRLAPHTSIALHDAQSRNEPSGPDLLATVTLERGILWVQGFIPDSLPGMTVAVGNGYVTVNEGSVSLSATANKPLVTAYDRHVQVLRNDSVLTLAAGQSLALKDAAKPQNISVREFTQQWPSQNLARDAAHRQEIAQLQMQRRIAAAGILPTSSLYPVKRVAEAVDLLLTLSADDKLEKQLSHADTRLSEAVALLQQEDDSAAQQPLQEYASAVKNLSEAVAGDLGSEAEVASTIAVQSAEIAAVLPSDAAYPVKQVILEAATVVDTHNVSPEIVKRVLVADALTALTNAVSSGAVADIETRLAELQPALEGLKNAHEFSITERKELSTTLERLAAAVNAREQELSAASGTTIFTDLQGILPQDATPVVVALTQEEVEIEAQAIKERVYIYGMPRSRLNQLIVELRRLEHHPDAGRILRSLFLHMPPNSELTQLVRRGIRQQRWSQEQE